MNLKVEYKGQKKSKLTISSLGEVRVKIADKDKAIEKEIIDFAKAEKERLGDVEFTVRQEIITEDGKIKTFTKRK